MTLEEKLGRAVTALVHVPEDRLDLVRDFAIKLAGPDGALWEKESKNYLRKEPRRTYGQVTQVAEMKPSTYTRCISGGEVIIIDATDGSKTIRNSNIFRRQMYQNLGTLLEDGACPDRRSIKVTVHEQILTGNLRMLFGSPIRKFPTEHQVVSFVENHKKWLGKLGCVTILPFAVGDIEQVAEVFFGTDGQLAVRVDLLSEDIVVTADGRHRVVIPQPEPLTPSVS